MTKRRNKALGVVEIAPVEKEKVCHHVAEKLEDPSLTKRSICKHTLEGDFGNILEERLHNRVINDGKNMLPKSEIKKLVLKSVGLDKKIKLKSKSSINNYAD